MKLNKKAAMLISLAVGAIMFSAAAIAEVTSKSGYDQLKDVIKITKSKHVNLSNYTLNASFVAKRNGNTIYSADNVKKFDYSKADAEEFTTVTKIANDKPTNDYNYYGKDCYVRYNSDNGDVYYKDNNGGVRFVLIDGTAPDEIEVIVDAILGDLKDYVAVTQNDDGSKVLSASLNVTQITSIINTLISKKLLLPFMNNYYSLNAQKIRPAITSDITIMVPKGTITVDKDGLIRSFSGTIMLSGKDASGAEQKLSIDVLYKLTNINSTVVKKPDLSGKKVIDVTAKP